MRMQAGMRFRAWTRTQTARDDRIGDLCRDFRDDKQAPQHFPAWRGLERYMLRKGASAAAIEAARAAWREYQQSAKR